MSLAPNITPFYPKFYEEGIDPEAKINEYRTWLEEHGDYGRLFMWHIGKYVLEDGTKSGDNTITGVKIYDPEVAMLFRIMHGL
jgi:hypothetical protein